MYMKRNLLAIEDEMLLYKRQLICLLFTFHFKYSDFKDPKINYDIGIVILAMNLAFAHEPGTAISCLSIPIILHKEGPPGVPETELKCGFKIGGGIDQDYRKSPQVYSQ